MYVRTNPPGAMVYVDDYPIGTTPISHEFTYYGTRKVRLVKPGYETLTVYERMPPPWYEIPPLDFVSENMVPGEFRDHRTLSFQLVPQKVVPTEELLGRAEALRTQAHASDMARTSPVPPGVIPPTAPAADLNLSSGVPPSGGVQVPDLPSGGWPQRVGP
jgi:hypothetical protein